MRVAIVMPLGEQKGGAELLLLHLLKGNHPKTAVEYGVAFLEDGPMVGIAKTFTSLVRVFRAGRLRQANLYLTSTLGLARWLRRERFEMVMSWMPMAHFYGSVAAMLTGLPSVWWQHGFADRSLVERLTERLPSSGTFCCSAAVEEAHRKVSPKSQNAVIHPAVDLAVFDPNVLSSPVEQRDRLGLPKNCYLIGIFGRLQRWKGMDTFVEAAAILARERPDVHFLIVGGTHSLEPHYPQELAALVEKLGLNGRVNLAGFQTKPAEWMSACDIVVHASIKPEPFGMVILEAMALGKTVIAAEAGGPLEFVEHGVNGYLSQPGNAPALATNMRMALDGKVSKALLSARARSTAARFSIARFADEVGEQLHRVLTR